MHTKESLKNLDEIVNHTSIPYLDVILSGPIPPNPSELILSDVMKELIDELKTKYDYIIMDSAPLMLVSDSMHLVDVSDLLIYTVKSEFTDNEMLSFAKNFKRDNQIVNMVFVLNNVKPEYSKYGYKYGYGYYSNNKPENKLAKLFRKNN